MELNTELTDKPTHIWSINLQQRSQEYMFGKEHSLPYMVLGKLGIQMQKSEIRPLSYTIYTKYLKVDGRLECKYLR